MDDENEKQQKRTSDMTGFNFVFVYISWIIIKTVPTKQATGKYIQKRENKAREKKNFRHREK